MDRGIQSLVAASESNDPYMVKTLKKKNSLQPKGHMTLKSVMYHLDTGPFVQMIILGMSLTYLTARSNLFVYASLGGKSLRK